MSDLPFAEIKPASDPPPNRKATSEPSAPRINKTTEINIIIKSLEKTYSAVGMGLMLVNPADAQVVAANASELAESWRSLLETNTKVRKSFMRMMEASGWSTVIMAHLMVAMPIINNHKASFEHLTAKKKPQSVQPDTMGQSPTASNL